MSVFFRSICVWLLRLRDAIAPEGWQDERGFHLGKQPVINRKGAA